MFSITGMTVDAAGNVVSLNWCYENADGKLSNTHKLAQPFGVLPIAQVTEDIAIGWLTAQLGNTAAEFDAAIANAKTQAEYQAGFVAYVPNEEGTFSAYVPPVPEEQPVATPY